MCSGGRGQHLLPWPNRIGDGSYRFDGEEYQLALSEPPRSNAIHGLVRWLNWDAEIRSENQLTMRHRLHPQTGYPFSLDLAIDYVLDERGLSVTTSALNIGVSTAPYGAGAHPYLSAGTATIDPCSVVVPAATRMLADDRMLPRGRAPVGGTEFDFRKPRPLGHTQLDTAFTALIRDDDGCARVVLESPAAVRLVLWLDAAYPWLMVFTGDGLEDPQRRRRGLAVEPMTCPPDAFRSREDVIQLRPGESSTARWGLDVSSFRRGL